MKTTKHLTSIYIVLGSDGKLYHFSYRPTDSYDGRSDRDFTFNYLQPFSMDLNHELWLGDKITIKKNNLYSGVTMKIAGTIVAKMKYNWDYSKPLGAQNRMSDLQQTKKFKYYQNIYRNQIKNKIYF